MKVGTRVRVIQDTSSAIKSVPDIGATGKIIRVFPNRFLVQFDEESENMHYGKILTPEFYNGKSGKWYCMPEVIEEIPE